MPFLYLDSTILLLVPALILALWANHQVKSQFERYSRIPSGSGMTGAELAGRLLAESNLSSVRIEETGGKLSDHYDPRSRTLRLSSAIGRSRSVAALGVAAHEVGHAIQHQAGYSPFRVRQSIVPVAQFGSSLAFPLFFIGFLFSGSTHSTLLMDIGIYLFMGVLAFQLVTLPVEFNASARAMALLSERGYLAGEEVIQARKVLNAAAWTYVAATAMAAVQLVRMFVLRGSRD